MPALGGLFGPHEPLFHDRFEAGRRLAERFGDLAGARDVLILAIPRGGVEVGYALAEALSLPLDVYLTRKIPVPGNPELALGAVACNGTLVLDRGLAERLNVGQEYIREAVAKQRAEMEQRLARYGSRTLSQGTLEGRRLVLVDDGVATGSTLLAGVRALRETSPAALMVGIPVGPRETLQELKGEVDRLESLASPEDFLAVGRFYERFEQTSDEEVIRLLEKLREG